MTEKKENNIVQLRKKKEESEEKITVRDIIDYLYREEGDIENLILIGNSKSNGSFLVHDSELTTREIHFLLSINAQMALINSINEGENDDE